MNFDHSFWEGRWKEKQTGWDIGGPHPGLWPLVSLAELTPPGRVWVPGCGRGHDVAALARAGFEVVGTDISPTAIGEASALYGSVPHAQFQAADLFAGSFTENFDWIYDRAMLCALAPGRQPDYLQVCKRALKPKGKFCSILFSRISEEVSAGPPFAVEPGHIEALFQGWRVLATAPWVPPPIPRVILSELLLVATPKT